MQIITRPLLQDFENVIYAIVILGTSSYLLSFFCITYAMQCQKF